MTNPYASFMTETDKEVDGVWNEYDGFRVKVARAGNRNQGYLKELGKITKRYKNLNKMNDSAQQKILAEVYAKHIVKNWGIEVERDAETGACIYEDGKIHVFDEEGNVSVSDFNKDAVVNILVALPDLFRSIRDFADELTNFQKEVEDEIVKN